MPLPSAHAIPLNEVTPPRSAAVPPGAALDALSRRRFLLWSSRVVVGAAALWAGKRFVAGSVPGRAGLRALGDRQYATLHALIRVLFPAGPVVHDAEAFATELTKVGDARLAALPGYVSEQLRAALLYLEASPLLLGAHVHTFTQLDEVRRAAHWSLHWEGSDDGLRRGAGIGLRRVISVWAYDTPSLWPAMHYPGPLLEPMPTE